MNLGSVLQSSPAFRDAGKSLADEQSRLQKHLISSHKEWELPKKGVTAEKAECRIDAETEQSFPTGAAKAERGREAGS